MGLIDGVGCWSTGSKATRATPSPALFLDRDGVVVIERGFLADPADVELQPGAPKLIAKANDCGLPVVIVTNQSGIARGYFGWPQFEAVQLEIIAQLGESGARIDGVYACGYHPDGRPPLAVANHPWRKPRGGMLVAAGDDLLLDLGRSWIIGDRATDLEAGRAAGLAGGIHVMTGHANDIERARALRLSAPDFSVRATDTVGTSVFVVADLAEEPRC